MTLCTISISGAAPASAKWRSEWIHPQPVLWDLAPHTDKRKAGSSVGLQSHIMLSSGVPSPPRSSVVFHTLLISIPHSLQPDTRETSHSKLKEPSEELKTVLPCSPDKTGGRRSDWHRHCWTAASSDRHVMGPSHERLGRRAVFLAPGVSSFPRKQISPSSVVFLAACAEACSQERRGAFSGAGSRPFPGQACQDCSSQTAPHPQHSTAMALPPHTCNKHVSPQGRRRVFRPPRK